VSKKVLVVGKGAIGVAVASRLKMLGFQPVFVGRKGPIDVHVHFKGWGQSFWLDVKKLSDTDLGSVSGCFLAVKAFDLEGAANRFIPYLQSGTPVISLSNGATQDIMENVQNKFAEHAIRLGFCTSGVTMVNENHFEMRSQTGGVYWGSLKNGLSITDFEKSLSTIQNDNFFSYLDPIFSSHRIKWLFNTVLNSICAVNEHSNNGKLLEDVDYLRTVFEEAYILGEEIWGAWIEKKNKLFDDMISLITSTRFNENSMFRDIKLKQKTESKYLAGMAPDREKYSELVRLHNEILNKTPKNVR
jgi:ketopantoate reductase